MNVLVDHEIYENANYMPSDIEKNERDHVERSEGSEREAANRNGKQQ